MNGRRVRICLAASVGGHLSEILQLRPAYGGHDHFYVVNDSLLLPEVMKGRTFFIRHSERDLLCLWNVWEAFRIFRRERPTHLISTGAGLAVPLAVVARLMGIRVLFIETFAAIHKPTLTGRIVYHIAHEILYQWEQLGSFYPRGTYAGDVFGICNGRQCDSAV